MSVITDYYNQGYAALPKDRCSTIEKFARIADFPPNRLLRILDLGCGPGTVSKTLVQEGHEVHGLDAAAAAVEEARNNGIIAKVFNLDGGEPLPYPERYFDIVLALDVLEHLFDPAVIVREIHRVLVDCGSLIVVFPNHFDLQNRLRMLRGKGIVHWDHVGLANAWDYFHIRFLRLSDARAFLKQNGFYVDKLQLNFIPYHNFPILRVLMRLPTRWSKLLLRKYPDLFSGKFVMRTSKQPSSHEDWVVLPFTPPGL